MNRKGFIFTLDATLSLIPVFLLLISASSLAPSTSFGTLRYMKMNRFAHDSMMVLSDRTGDNNSPLESYLNTSNTSLIENFLNNTGAQWNYMIRINTTTGWTYVTGKADNNYDQDSVTASLNNAPDIAVDSKVAINVSQGNSTMHLLRMNVWG